MKISTSLVSHSEIWKYQHHWYHTVRHENINITGITQWDMKISTSLVSHSETWKYQHHWYHTVRHENINITGITQWDMKISTSLVSHSETRKYCQQHGHQTARQRPRQPSYTHWKYCQQHEHQTARQRPRQLSYTHWVMSLWAQDHLVSPVVKVSTLRGANLGSIHTFSMGTFLGRVRPVT